MFIFRLNRPSCPLRLAAMGVARLQPLLKQALLLLAAVSKGAWGAGSRVTLTIGAVQPITGGWPAGYSMGLAAQKMADYINANSELLPDYELRVLWQDGGCDPSVGVPLLHRNWFEKT